MHEYIELENISSFQIDKFSEIGFLFRNFRKAFINSVDNNFLTYYAFISEQKKPPDNLHSKAPLEPLLYTWLEMKSLQNICPVFVYY